MLSCVVTADCGITDNPDMPAPDQNPAAPHWIVPYAVASDPQCRQALDALNLHHLQRLLPLLRADAASLDNDFSLTPPHERALAQALGLWPGPDAAQADGRVPWAAWRAGLHGTPCAWFWLCHWSVGMGQVTLHPPAVLDISEAHSLALLEALRPYAEEDGLRLVHEAPGRWRAEGEPLRNLASASLDRVAHRRIDGWLPDGPAAQPLLRLQNEAQMLFYNHPTHDERVAQGLPPLNGFWISGSGHWGGQPASQPEPVVLDLLRDAALQGDWKRWATAWQALDNGPVRDLLQRAEQAQPLQLTLCGERGSRTWSLPAGGRTWRERLQTRLNNLLATPRPQHPLTEL